MALVGEFFAKTAAEFRDDGLRTLRFGLIRAGVSNPNVSPGSDYYALFQAIGNELEVISANVLVKSDDAMPDTAVEDALDRWLTIVGLTRRSAAGSSGAIVFDSSAVSPVVAGTELLDGKGFRYSVQTSALYADDATIAISAIDAGADTNLEAGETLRWVTAPPFSADTALVATGGLTGGADAEDDETARRRLIRRLSTFPGSGNWTQVAETAEAATPKIQVAFPYPAAQGPATQHVAVVAYTSDTNKTREIDAATMTGLIEPYIVGALAEHSDVVVTTVTDVETNVAIFLSLPASSAASVPGPGGGWMDGTPWPRPVEADVDADLAFCAVTAVTNTTRFSVRASQSPTANSTRICWFSPLEWKLYTATVLTIHSFAANVADITIDQPFIGIAADHLISPQSVKQQDYFDAVIDHFALMGPGEKTDNASVLARAYRRPTPASQWPASLDSKMLRKLSNVGDEVLDVDYAYRSVTSPAVPASVTDPPNILVPLNLAFYELTT